MKKILITIVATVLVCACIVGGTVAWLMDSTQTVTNTFTIGNINIELTESKVGEGTANESGKYKMIPGSVIDKDPTITVKKDSEACWLFVKVEAVNDFGTYMEYAINSAWKELPDVDGVYYQKIDEVTADKTVPILAGATSTDGAKTWDANQVYVKSTITKTQADALNELTEDKLPALKFTAYAIQQSGFENEANIKTAWDAIQNDINSAP